MYNFLKWNEIAAIKDKHWQLDCGQMKLVRNDSTYSFDGSGYIRMEQDGSMSFKIYLQKPIDMKQSFKLSFENFDKLIPMEKCFTLTANDIYGRSWKAISIRPNVPLLSENNITISGYIYREVKGSSKTEFKLAHGQLSFICFEKYDFPFNAGTTEYHDEDGKPVKSGWSLDTAKFSINELSFFLRNKDEQFTISITSKAPSISSLVETRVIEALQFVLGRAINWCILERHDDGTEYVIVRSCPTMECYIHPPLKYRGPGQTDYWELFTKYFEYICQNIDESVWHPISIFIHRLFEARKASVETQCLAITVIIEGLLRTEFKDLAKPSNDLLGWIDKVEDILMQSGTPSEIAKRMTSVIEGMKTPRPSDQLQELLKQEIITKKEKDTWSKLRNSSAHPERAFFEDYKEAIDAFDTVLTLFYKLIFRRIGYFGKYTDYGSTDMADETFQPKT
jgi:hypothetical protein